MKLKYAVSGQKFKENKDRKSIYRQKQTKRYKKETTRLFSKTKREKMK